MLKAFKVSIVSIFLFFGVGFSCLAQPPGGLPPQANVPPGKGPPGDPITDPDVPISGVEFLLLAGGLFGAKKYFDNRKQNSDSKN